VCEREIEIEIERDCCCTVQWRRGAWGPGQACVNGRTDLARGNNVVCFTLPTSGGGVGMRGFFTVPLDSLIMWPSVGGV
jgi:hypothetical protein